MSVYICAFMSVSVLFIFIDLVSKITKICQNANVFVLSKTCIKKTYYCIKKTYSHGFFTSDSLLRGLGN